VRSWLRPAVPLCVGPGAEVVLRGCADDGGDGGRRFLATTRPLLSRPVGGTRLGARPEGCDGEPLASARSSFTPPVPRRAVAVAQRPLMAPARDRPCRGARSMHSVASAIPAYGASRCLPDRCLARSPRRWRRLPPRRALPRLFRAGADPSRRPARPVGPLPRGFAWRRRIRRRSRRRRWEFEPEAATRTGNTRAAGSRALNGRARGRRSTRFVRGQALPRDGGTARGLRADGAETEQARCGSRAGAIGPISPIESAHRAHWPPDPRRRVASVPGRSLRSVSGAKPARGTSVRHIQAGSRKAYQGDRTCFAHSGATQIARSRRCRPVILRGPRSTWSRRREASVA
jgi:hypothetical protein